MIQSEIAFTPEVGSEIIGQRGTRWIDAVTWPKEDSSFFERAGGVFPCCERSVLRLSQSMKLEMLK